MGKNDYAVTEEEREAFMYMLRDSGREDYPLKVSWCVSFEGEQGNTCSMWGVVKWVDPKTRRVQLANQTISQWIEMEKIIDVHA